MGRMEEYGWKINISLPLSLSQSHSNRIYSLSVRFPIPHSTLLSTGLGWELSQDHHRHSLYYLITPRNSSVSLRMITIVTRRRQFKVAISSSMSSSSVSSAYRAIHTGYQLAFAPQRGQGICSATDCPATIRVSHRLSLVLHYNWRGILPTYSSSSTHSTTTAGWRGRAGAFDEKAQRLY